MVQLMLIIGVLKELMPDHWNDENIQQLVNDFYQNYTNPSQRLLKYQEQLFTQSQRLCENEEMKEKSEESAPATGSFVISNG